MGLSIGGLVLGSTQRVISKTICYVTPNSDHPILMKLYLRMMNKKMIWMKLTRRHQRVTLDKVLYFELGHHLTIPHGYEIFAVVTMLIFDLDNFFTIISHKINNQDFAYKGSKFNNRLYRL